MGPPGAVEGRQQRAAAIAVNAHGFGAVGL